MKLTKQQVESGWRNPPSVRRAGSFFVHVPKQVWVLRSWHDGLWYCEGLHGKLCAPRFTTPNEAIAFAESNC